MSHDPPRTTTGTRGAADRDRAWSALGYGKHSTAEHQMEWSIIEALFRDQEPLRYVGSSGIEYPCRPEDGEALDRLLGQAQQARTLLAGFTVPEPGDGERPRSYGARVANALEDHLRAILAGTPSAAAAPLAADRFLSRVLLDPPNDPGF